MLPAEFYVIQDAVLTHGLTHKHRFGILTNVKSKFLSFSIISRYIYRVACRFADLKRSLATIWFYMEMMLLDKLDVPLFSFPFIWLKLKSEFG
jgi:hypothetical protein